MRIYAALCVGPFGVTLADRKDMTVTNQNQNIADVSVHLFVTESAYPIDNKLDADIDTTNEGRRENLLDASVSD